MDAKIKQKIKNIVALAEKNNKLADELKGLDDYKNKLNKVKEHYARVQGTKTRRPTRKSTTSRKSKSRK